MIRFEDKCKVERPSGLKDEWDNPVSDLLYEGDCLYDEGSSSTKSNVNIEIQSAVVFIKGTDIQFKNGDGITIDTIDGYTAKGVIKRVKKIKFYLFNKEHITRLEINQIQSE